MVGITNEPMFRVLKGVQQDVRALKAGHNELRDEMISVPPDLASAHRDLNNVTLARRERRLDRIERRLDLPEPQRPFDPSA